MTALVNEKTWWFLSRSSGIVAMVLIVASVVWGVLLVTKLSKSLRPAWTLEVHKWLSGLAFCAMMLHLLGLYLDSWLTFGPKELFLPGASEYRPLAVGVGVLSLYGLIAVQATAMMRRWLPKRVWRGVHLLSYLVAWGGLMHAGLAGTDTRHRAYQLVAGATALALTVAVLARLLGPRRGGKADRRTPTSAAPTDVAQQVDPATTNQPAPSAGPVFPTPVLAVPSAALASSTGDRTMDASPSRGNAAPEDRQLTADPAPDPAWAFMPPMP